MSAFYLPTRADIRGRVRFYIDESVQANFTDNDINYAINDVQQDVVLELVQVAEDYFVNSTPSPITLEAGIQYYTLPADFLKVARVEDAQTGLMIPITDLDSQNNFFQTPIPPLVNITAAGYAAMIVGTTIGFTPLPTTPQTVNLYYVPVAPDLQSDTDTTVIPRPYVDLLAIQAAIDCFIKDEADTAALERKYAAKLARLIRTSRDRQQQNPKKVRRVGDTTQYPGWSL